MAAKVKEPANTLSAELDCKLSSSFRPFLKSGLGGGAKDKPAKYFRAVRERVVDHGFGMRLDALFSDFCRPPDHRRHRASEEAVAEISMLLDRAFVETAAVLFVAWKETLAELTLTEILPAVPDATSLQAWIKIKKASTQDIARQLLGKPVETYATAGADWLLERGKPDQLIPLLDLFLSRRERAQYLPAWNAALCRALGKDRSGALLSVVLRHPWPDAGRIAALADAAGSNRGALRNSVEVLPGVIGGKNRVPGAVAFVNGIFGTIAAVADREREIATVAMARLGTGLLLSNCRGPEVAAMMALIEKSTRQLRNLTRDESVKSRTWLLENLSSGEQLQDGRLHISLEGARHLALAFEKAAQGFGAKEILTVTARNLGLSPIGSTGDRVSYNPLLHEDVKGGLVPGETASVEEVGWAVREEPVIRAKVRKG